MARCKELLIDDFSYIQVLCFSYELNILYLGNCLLHAIFFGCQARKNIRFGAVGERNECIVLLNALIMKNIYIASIAMHYIAIG